MNKVNKKNNGCFEIICGSVLLGASAFVCLIGLGVVGTTVLSVSAATSKLETQRQLERQLAKTMTPEEYKKYGVRRTMIGAASIIGASISDR